MKCPDCGTSVTHVVSTRTDRGVLVRRRHECGNGHRFNSLQVHESALRGIGMRAIDAALDRVAAGITRRTIAELRKRKVARLVSDGLATTQIATKLGISEARVRQIRSKQ
jgi:transcriptional regulator NrdR family protein